MAISYDELKSKYPTTELDELDSKVIKILEERIDAILEDHIKYGYEKINIGSVFNDVSRVSDAKKQFIIDHVLNRYKNAGWHVIFLYHSNSYQFSKNDIKPTKSNILKRFASLFSWPSDHYSPM